MLLARQSEQVDRLGGDDQGVGGIEPARNADHHALGAGRAHAAARGRRPGCCRPRSNPAPAALRRSARTGSARPCAGSRCRSAGGFSANVDPCGKTPRVAGDCRRTVPISARSCLSRSRSTSAQRDLAALAEPLALGQQHAVLVDRGLAVPGQICGRFPCPGSGIDVGRKTARRCRLAQQRARARPADRDRAAREVDRARWRRRARARGRRHRNPHVLADLDADGQARDVLGREQQVNTERGMQPAKRDRLSGDAGAGGEMPSLVEFAIGRQIALGHDAEDVAAMNDDGAIVDAIDQSAAARRRSGRSSTPRRPRRSRRARARPHRAADPA